MIVVKLELWPGGDGSRRKLLGTMNISNIGGTKKRGRYAVFVCGAQGHPLVDGTTTLTDYPRLRHHPWVLVLRALAATMLRRDRNFTKQCLNDLGGQMQGKRA